MNLNKRIPFFSCLLMFTCLTFSCSEEPVVKENQLNTPKSETSMEGCSTLIDLYLVKGPNATGSILIELRDFYGNILDNASVYVPFMINGWNLFEFFPQYSGYENELYVHVYRTNPDSFSTGDYIWWRSVPRDEDVYPGETSTGLGDFAFVVDGGCGNFHVEQPLTSYGYTLGIKSRWQEIIL